MECLEFQSYSTRSPRSQGASSSQTMQWPRGLRCSVDTLTRQQALQLQHDSLSEVWRGEKKEKEKNLEALSPVERAYFRSSATGNTGAVGYGICRTLVLAAPLDLCSQRQFSRAVDHCLDHFSLKYVLVTSWEIDTGARLLCQWRNRTQDNIVLKRRVFPREVSAESPTQELLDHLPLPNICFLPLHVKAERVNPLYKRGGCYCAVSCCRGYTWR